MKHPYEKPLVYSEWVSLDTLRADQCCLKNENVNYIPDWYCPADCGCPETNSSQF